jgi:hypothetical protein
VELEGLTAADYISSGVGPDAVGFGAGVRGRPSIFDLNEEPEP